jgi:hypothetical protein
METSSLESVPEIIECDGYCSGSESWLNISGAKFTVTVYGPFGGKKYTYTFNNLWNKKISFCLELNVRENGSLESLEIIKTTTKQ